MEHRLGSRESRCRIRGEQPQTAQRRVHRATHRIVHPHLFQRARHHVRSGLAARRIDEGAIILLDEQHVVRPREQLATLQRHNDRQ